MSAKQIIIFISFICNLASCQTKNKECTILEFKALNENEDEQYFKIFQNSHSLSIMLNHRCHRTICDSLYYIHLTPRTDTLYVYNYSRHHAVTIALNKIPKYPIDHVYYHNHDSIFLFYKREIMCKYFPDIHIDFILMNDKGQLINQYSLDSVPYIYKGQLQKMLFQTPALINENRIVDGHLLIPFSIYLPQTYDDEFYDFQPKLLCAYNLSNQSLRMLNVKFPEQEIGKRYGEDCITNHIYMEYDENKKNLLINFPHQPTLYRYDFTLDSLLPIQCTYDYTFTNTLFASHSEIDPMDVEFEEPKWCRQMQCYVRKIYIDNYKNHEQKLILQLLDSNFNHMAYSLGTANYETPYLMNNQLISVNIKNKLPYNIQFTKNIKTLSWEKLEADYFKEYIKKGKRSMSMEKYLKKLHIPRNSLVVIINLKYPCGNCLNYLFGEMKNNVEDYKKACIYYILYNNDPSSDFGETLINNYGLSSYHLVKIDKYLLQNVYNDDILDYQYHLIEYGDTVKIYKCDFEEFIPLFQKIEKEKLNN